MITKESVINVLKQINDPEILVDVWTMGLIYNIKINEKKKVITITMTLTTPMCPYGPMLLEEIKVRLKEDTGAKEVILNLTFDPPWQPSDELRMMLGV